MGLGATGTELEDAVVLLSRLAAPEADDTALAKAAEELQERRPELFDQRTLRPSAAPPLGSPSNIPGRSGDTASRSGQIGLDIAHRRSHIKST
ncbi:hypothetical protein [Streptomyces sp. CB02400]|uniref:hypothetical protein n=1 Tax=Streptomyces sp. CB02400 TaxID=1703944 RepID=UPI000938CFBD|nr:hypothetical protein [Streptomyces sp. CB02400]OKJ89144.1 hypothetical protein AMK33_37200 [Streptomyces sp. CB02400]